ALVQRLSRRLHVPGSRVSRRGRRQERQGTLLPLDRHAVKRDCPHCHKSMGGRFMRTTQLTNIDKSRNCPLCNGNIELRMHPEEVVARLATIVAVIVAG